MIFGKSWTAQAKKAWDNWGGEGYPDYRVLLHAAVFTPVVQAYRFYDDGTEDGSNPKAAQDTDVSILTDTDQQVHLRYRIQETGGASGATTDDYALQYNKNGAGFVAITATSSNIQADTASSLTDGVATTNRATNGITDGTGSFVAGEQEEGNGTIEDRQLTASNFTEHVWALKIIAADVANNDVFDFRVTLNGGSPGMTNSVVPTITTTKTPPPAQGLGWYGSMGAW